MLFISNLSWLTFFWVRQVSCIISTLGSFIIQDKILEDTGEALYKEAISIASDQADADYSRPHDAEVSYNNLNTSLPNIKMLVFWF